MPFAAFGFHPALLQGIRELGFTRPTPIQEASIPPALDGRDLIACAMTGSGKTAAFGLPILQRMLVGKRRGATRALILTPTRELAAQIEQHLSDLAMHTPVSCAAIFGGVGMGPQEHALRSGVDVIVATPGRLLDHLRHSYARLTQLEVLVLDEADRMLDMGFLPDIERVLRHLPARKQTLLFSATMPKEIAHLAERLLHDPVRIAHQRQAAPASGITQAVYPVPQHLKSELLKELILRNLVQDVLVFTRTRARTDRLAKYLTKNGIECGRLHGDRSQNQRTATMNAFKSGELQVLVATDIAARGIDVEQLGHVINYDVPNVVENYIHREGRTARAEAVGDAFTFVSHEEEGDLREIEKAVGRRLPRVHLPDFDYMKPPEKKVPHAGGSGAPGRRAGGRFGQRGGPNRFRRTRR